MDDNLDADALINDSHRSSQSIPATQTVPRDSVELTGGTTSVPIPATSLAAEFDLPPGDAIPTPQAAGRRLDSVDLRDVHMDAKEAADGVLGSPQSSFVADPQLLRELSTLVAQTAIARQTDDDGVEVDKDWTWESGDSVMSQGWEVFIKHLSQIVATHRPFAEIRFKRLSYSVNVPAGTPRRSTFGSAFLSILHALTCRQTNVQDKRILNDVSGVFKPGTMTLVLGPPQSGKSTLLQVLAGRARGGKMSGQIQINGQDATKLHREKIIGISDQEDNHLAALTVKETFEFAQACQSFYPKLMDDKTELAQFMRIKVDAMLIMLGLARVKDTRVGDDLARGVSGGERKRVTIGEILLANRLAFFLDEASTGLDSATTLHLMQRLSLWAKALGTTFVISLLQPSPDVFNCFDSVLLMAQGSIIYHGPRDRVMPYFNSIGYFCPFHKDIADFLQELPTPAGAEYLDPVKAQDPGTPRTVHNFVERFKRSDIFHNTVAELSAPSTYELVNKGKDSKEAFEPYIARHFNEDFVMPWFESTTLVFKRQLKLAFRDVTFIKVRFFQCLFVGILTGTMFWQMPPTSSLLRFGVIFFALLFLVLGSLPQVPLFIKYRSVFYKHRASNFFRTGSWVLSMNVVAIPEQVMEIMVFGTIVYWFSGLTSADNGTHYAYFLFMALLNGIAVAAFLRMLACLAPDLTLSQPISGLAVIAMVLFGGFLITHENIPRGWIWMYWLSPFSWGLRAVVINEYNAPTYHYPLLLAGTNDSFTTQATVALNSLQFYSDTQWQWWAVLYMIGFSVVCMAVSTCFLNCVRFDQKKRNSSKREDEFDPFKETERDLAKQRGVAVDIPNKMQDLPFTPATLTFEGITYSVPGGHKGEYLELLKDVSGFARPRTMTALMGSSGAGKTTLLDCLGLRKTAGRLKGDVRINAHHIDHHTYRRLIGYVEQNDIHSPSATVREAFLFSCRLRLSNDSTAQNITDEDRRRFVDNVIDMLELNEQADLLIGSAMAGGLTLDQRKRVTMGVELVANPSIIFLDEPTSGLDSRAAMVVMRAMRKIAETGRTVVCTIHQPSAQIFSLFDSILLLKRGGQVVFFDELGENGANLTSYLAAIQGVKPIGPNENPAEYMLETIDPSQEKELGVDFGLLYGKSELFKRTLGELKKLLDANKNDKPIKFSGRFAASTGVQLKECLRKAFVMYWRSPSYSFFRLLFLSVVALAIGSVYFQLGTSDEAGIHSAISVIYFTIVFCGIVNQNTVLPIMAGERAVFYRERAANTYGNLAFAVATGIVELPYLALNSMCFVVIYYFMVGFQLAAGHFFYYFLIFFLYCSMSTYFGQLLIVYLPSIQVATLLGSAMINMWTLTCGFFVPRPDIPNFWIWLYWVNPIRYALEALAVDQYFCTGLSCDTLYVNDGVQGASNRTVSDYVTGTFGFDYDYRWVDVGVLIAFMAGYRFLIYWGLRKVRHISR